MTTSYAERAERIRQAHDRNLQNIRDRFTNREITSDMRDTLVARVTTNTRRQLDQLREAENAERTNRKRTLERRLFAPDSSDGNDPATRAAAFRQARDHARQLDDEGAIAEEMRAALRADDKLMLKALFERAHDINQVVNQVTQGKGLSKVVAGYLNEIRPDLTDDYRELHNMVTEDQSITGKLTREAAYLMPTPREIERYPEHRFDQIANDPRFEHITDYQPRDQQPSDAA